MRQGKTLLAVIMATVLVLSSLMSIDHTVAFVYDRTLPLVNTFVPAQASEAGKAPEQWSAGFENQSTDDKGPPATGDGFPLQEYILVFISSGLLLYVLLCRKNRYRKTA